MRIYRAFDKYDTLSSCGQRVTESVLHSGVLRHKRVWQSRPYREPKLPIRIWIAICR